LRSHSTRCRRYVDSCTPRVGGRRHDSPEARAVGLRALCVEHLGSTLFQKLYRCMRHLHEEEDEAEEEKFRTDLRAHLGEHHHFVALLDRLIYEEDMIVA
jgi:hypothetical protein